MKPLVSVLLCFAILLASSSCRAQQAAAGPATDPSTSSSPSSWLSNFHGSKVEPMTNPRYWTPNNFASLLLFRNPRQIGDEPMGSNRLALLGSKRSSSALDSLAGVTIGKRAAPFAELINMDQVYGRAEAQNSIPRGFRMRTTPFASSDSLDYPFE